MGHVLASNSLWVENITTSYSGISRTTLQISAVFTRMFTLSIPLTYHTPFKPTHPSINGL